MMFGSDPRPKALGNVPVAGFTVVPTTAVGTSNVAGTFVPGVWSALRPVSVTDPPTKVPAGGVAVVPTSLMVANGGTANPGGKTAGTGGGPAKGALVTVTVMVLPETAVVKPVLAGQPMQMAVGDPLNAPPPSAVKTIVSPGAPADAPAY